MFVTFSKNVGRNLAGATEPTMKEMRRNAKRNAGTDGTYPHYFLSPGPSEPQPVVLKRLRRFKVDGPNAIARAAEDLQH